MSTGLLLLFLVIFLHRFFLLARPTRLDVLSSLFSSLCLLSDRDRESVLKGETVGAEFGEFVEVEVVVLGEGFVVEGFVMESFVDMAEHCYVSEGYSARKQAGDWSFYKAFLGSCHLCHAIVSDLLWSPFGFVYCNPSFC